MQHDPNLPTYNELMILSKQLADGNQDLQSAYDRLFVKGSIGMVAMLFAGLVVGWIACHYWNRGSVRRPH